MFLKDNAERLSCFVECVKRDFPSGRKTSIAVNVEHVNIYHCKSFCVCGQVKVWLSHGLCDYNVEQKAGSEDSSCLVK